MHASTGSSSIVMWFAVGLTAIGLLPARVMAQRGLPHLIEPPEGSVQFGQSVASGGDVNEDGVDDLFIADPGFAVDGVRGGRWFIYDGATREMLWSAVGEEALYADAFTWGFHIPAAFIADMDGDGGDEVIVGRPSVMDLTGIAVVYSGRTGVVLHRFVGEAANDLLGMDVARVGDINDDGVDDFAFTTRYWSVTGRVSFRSGRDASELYEVTTPFPRRVRGIGDIDGDGYDDAAIGAYPYSNDPQINIISGRTGESTTIHSPGGWREEGFGYALAGGVDVTGDRVPDLLIGSAINSNSRVVYVMSGATLEIVNSIPEYLPRSLFGMRVEFADMNGDGAFEALIADVYAVNVYEPLTGALVQRLGASLSSGVRYGTEFATGDFNGDRLADLAAAITSGEVGLHAGAALLLRLLNETYPPNNLQRSGEYAFVVYGGQPGRRVHLLASLTGHDCTFIQQLGICIDLDARIYHLGEARTDAEGFAQVPLVVGPNVPIGSAWLQAIDPADPSRGPITSNVMQIEVVE